MEAVVVEVVEVAKTFLAAFETLLSDLLRFLSLRSGRVERVPPSTTTGESEEEEGVGAPQAKERSVRLPQGAALKSSEDTNSDKF